MSYVALYRKFRPKTFDEVKGQEQITTILKNQVKGNRIGHAYLFSGTRGTGKTSAAKIFAKAVNCEQPIEGSPCGVCSCCKRIAEGTNLNVVEIDAASTNGVDNIREIIEEVRYSPTEGRYKVYIIDEVHMLSIGAFNALLKTLEEPPSYVIFILATTEIHKIPVTILSRCQRYDFRRITADTIQERLRELMEAEGAEYEEEALAFIARKGDGSMRDALSLLDQCLSFYFGEPLTFVHALEVLGAVDVDRFLTLFRAIKKTDVPACMDLVEEISSAGLDLGPFVSDFIWFLRNLLLLSVSPQSEKRMDVSPEKVLLMKEALEGIREEELIYFIKMLSKLAQEMKYATKKRAELEIALIRLAKPEMVRSEESLSARLAKIERLFEEGEFSQKKVTEQETVIEKTSKAPAAQKAPAPVKKALPEEIQKIAKEFSTLLSKPNIKQPLRGYLKKVIPLYEEESNSLVLGCKDEIATEIVGTAEALALMKANIEETFGGSCEVKVKRMETARKDGDTEILGLDTIPAELLYFED